MANMVSIHESLGPNVCRRCIRRAYRVDLLPKDCVYAHFPGVCSCCEEPHNLVTGLTLSGKLKLLGKSILARQPDMFAGHLVGQFVVITLDVTIVDIGAHQVIVLRIDVAFEAV